MNRVRRLILLETIEKGAVFLTSTDAIIEKKDKWVRLKKSSMFSA